MGRGVAIWMKEYKPRMVLVLISFGGKTPR
jgi:hypothetical protein